MAVRPLEIPALRSPKQGDNLLININFDSLCNILKANGGTHTTSMRIQQTLHKKVQEKGWSGVWLLLSC